MEDLSGKTIPGCQRGVNNFVVPHIVSKKTFAQVFPFVSGYCLNEALFPGGTKGECAEWYVS
jgi:hypothetical protein